MGWAKLGGMGLAWLVRAGLVWSGLVWAGWDGLGLAWLGWAGLGLAELRCAGLDLAGVRSNWLDATSAVLVCAATVRGVATVSSSEARRARAVSSSPILTDANGAVHFEGKRW